VQEDLITEVAKSGKPIVLIVLAGRPLILENILKKTAAILYAWHPGTMCGPALVDLLFGIESPSGKLPVTFPKTEGQIPVYYNHKSTGRPPDTMMLTMINDIPQRAYQSSLGDAARYLDIGYLPQFPFGYGLSYSQFVYSNLHIVSEKIRLGETLKIEVQVTNAGPMEAEEVVQLYIRDVTASMTRPVRELKGFERIRLKPQEAQTVSFDLSSKNLGFHDSSMQYVVEPGRFQLRVGGDSQSGLRSSFILE
jgi:beta-glucosidase